MSRETDIKALKQLKNDMVEADAYAELANEEWEVARRIKAELEDTKFIFKPLPTNNEQTAKDGFISDWKTKFKNTSKFRMIFLTIYSLIMLVVSIILLIDFMGQKNWIFTDAAFVYNDSSAGEMLLVHATNIVFFLSATFLPWIQIQSKLPDFFAFITRWMIIGIAVGGLFFWYTASHSQSMYILFSYLIATATAFVIGFTIHIICLIISKIPVMSAKKKVILAAEKQKDIQNAELNKINEPKERDEWEKWWADYKPELREKGLHHISLGDTAMEKAKEHLANAEASDILGENEKSPEIIDLLISFIESRRADSIKEALHEYDKMEQNKKLLEIEAIKANLEIEKAKKENADRAYELEMNRRHQIEMEAQARRNADMQSQIAANTAAAAATAERMRKDAASAAADAAATQAKVAADVSAIYRNEYYNS